MAELIGFVKVPLVPATSTAPSGVMKFKNPEDADIIVTRVILDITTKSTGAATLNVGVHPDGSASNDSLMTAVDVGTAAGVFDSIKYAGANGKDAVLCAKGSFITATATASVAGLVGNAYIQYVRR
jgi:hypothetical protein